MLSQAKRSLIINSVQCMHFCVIYSAHKLDRQLLSKLIKSAVGHAYTSARELQFVRGIVEISAYEVRGTATSRAVFHSTPFKDILRNAYWSSKPTFTSFQLRDTLRWAFARRSKVSVPFRCSKTQLATKAFFEIVHIVFPQTLFGP